MSSALAAFDHTRTPHDARVYWGERVKSFDRIYAAVAERAPNIEAVNHLTKGMVAVASGHCSTAIALLRSVLEVLE